MDEFVCQLEKEAYYYVLRAFRIQSKDLSWEKEAVLTNLREELRISNDVHRELLRTLTSDETLNHLNNFNRTEPPRNIQRECNVNVMENTTRQREYNVNEMENAMKQREEPTSHGRRHQHARQNIPPHPKKTRRISELYCDDATRGQCTQPGGLGRHNDIPVTGRIRRHDNAGGTSIPPSPERDEMTLVDSKKLIDEVERILAESSPSNSSELERAKNLLFEQEKDLVQAIACMTTFIL